MTLAETKKYLDSLPLVEAQWWYIENISSDHEQAASLFFYLRERFRKHQAEVKK